ncbi:hypothetical protein Bhyg_03665, partial [Pseudolycoriella hygida]
AQTWLVKEQIKALAKSNRYNSTFSFLWDQNDANYKIAVKSASLQDLVKQLNNKFTGSYKNKQEIVVDECLEILGSVKEGSSSSASSDATKHSCECYGEYVTACLKAMSQWNQALAMADI